MEVATQHESASALILQNDPELFLRGITYLDTADPIDRLLVDLSTQVTYREVVDDGEQPTITDNLPTATEQHRLINGFKIGDLASTRQLIDSHLGLIAATAYPFKYKDIDPTELLRTGIRAFAKAAKTYDKDCGPTFYDYAIAAVHAAYREAAPDLAGDSFVELDEEHPMIGVYQFIDTLQIPQDPDEIKAAERQNEAHKNRRLTEAEREALPLLHLTEEGISEAIGTGDKASLQRSKRLVASLKLKLGASTKEEAALIALWRGITYELTIAPNIDDLNLDERLAAVRMWSSNEAVSEELEFNETKVQRIRSNIATKTGARSRAEIVLMAHEYGWEPTEEELNPPDLSLFEQMTDQEKQIVQLALHMSDREIAEAIEGDLNESAVGRIIGRLMDRASIQHNNRASLILKLHNQGMQFDVPILQEPVNNILYDEELKISRLLRLPYEKIIRKLKLGCTPERLGEIVYKARLKVGARSREELALMVKMYDDGSSGKDKSRENNKWRMANHLGVKTLSLCNVDALLAATTDLQRQIITAYYLADGPKTMPEVCSQLGISKNSARLLASRGLASMRRKLESDPSLRFD